ncbi:MAG TPA: hypothetical protein VK917_02280 [Ilumatobacter sp.]|nr:hypothetical protein [Ilumatobacter sp.]
MRVWKILGLAGLVGITAAGVAAGAKAAQRQRREYRDADVDELRASLRARLAAAGDATSAHR